MKKTDIIKLKELINSGWKINEEDGTIKNPVTGKNIKISTALGYDKNHPAYKLAVKTQGGEEPSSSKDDQEKDSQESDAKFKHTEDTIEDDVKEMEDTQLVDTYNEIERDYKELTDLVGESGSDSMGKIEYKTTSVKGSLSAMEPGLNAKFRNKVEELGLDGEAKEEFRDIVQSLYDYPLSGIRKYNEYVKQNPDAQLFNDDELKELSQPLGDLVKAQKRADQLANKYGIDGSRRSLDSLWRMQSSIYDEVKERGIDEDLLGEMEQPTIKNELKKLEEALTQVQKYQMDEPDHEGEMAKSQMLKTMKYSVEIMNMIDDSTNLPAWVQSKLTKIADYIGAVKHYMDSKTVRHVVTNMAENTKVEESTEIRLMDLVPVNSKKKINERLDRQTIKMMDGLHSYKKMDESLKTLVFIGRELTEEGFEKDEVIEYIQQRITKRLHVQL